YRSDCGCTCDCRRAQTLPAVGEVARTAQVFRMVSSSRVRSPIVFRKSITAYYGRSQSRGLDQWRDLCSRSHPESDACACHLLRRVLSNACVLLDAQPGAAGSFTSDYREPAVNRAACSVASRI